MKNYTGLPAQAFWIWLQHGLGANSAKYKRIASFYSSLQTFAESGRKEWKLMGFLTNKEMNLLESYSPEDAAVSFQKWTKQGIEVIAMTDEEYPPLLREIQTPPAVLYVMGKIPNFENSLGLAVVGTRNATLEGERTAWRFSRYLAQKGVIIVSGGALGVDSAAHNGALEAGGQTVCVMGCGLLSNYLQENQDLRRRITRSGALISEFTPETPASKWTFPIRNRIIAGLCEGTLVIEAAHRSGALITADFAAQEGRDVFAIPGSIENKKATGVNELIRDGASPVMNPEEILMEYKRRYPKKLSILKPTTIPNPSSSQTVAVKRTSSKLPIQKEMLLEMEEKERINRPIPSSQDSFQKETDFSLSETACLVLDKISHEKKQVDTLCHELGLPVGKVLSALLELELAGKVVQSSGKRYSLP